MSSYADASFIVSLYLPDANARKAAAVSHSANLPFLLTSLLELEIENAFHLSVFRKEQTLTQLRAVVSFFRRDLRSGFFLPKPLPSNVFERASHLVRRHTDRLGVRFADILHVASALEFKVKTFYTFDKRQGSLAALEGLKVIS